MRALKESNKVLLENKCDSLIIIFILCPGVHIARNLKTYETQLPTDLINSTLTGIHPDMGHKVENVNTISAPSRAKH